MHFLDRRVDKWINTVDIAPSLVKLTQDANPYMSSGP